MLAARRARYRRRVRAAFRAARLRLAALRRRDAPRACDAIARREADERGSRFSALRTLRERRADDLRDLPPRERSCFALRRVALDVCPGREPAASRPRGAPWTGRWRSPAS